jgi:nicotinamidase-related amidase
MTCLQPNWEPFALLLIDVQRDFWPESVAKVHPDFPANVASLLRLCRSAGIEIVHLRSRFKADRSDWMPRYWLRSSIPCIEGTPGEKTLPFAVDEAGEKIILKQTFDGFYNPELLEYLRKRGKRFVLTAGLVTSTCVLFTTTSAMQHGFLAAVVEDCCADEPDAHWRTLDGYPFIFERTTVGQLASHHSAWLAALEKLDEVKAGFSQGAVKKDRVRP